jgi:uncharacterized Zn-finger protein
MWALKILLQSLSLTSGVVNVFVLINSNIRFVMKVEETIIVKKSSVSCDGGGGALGHPKIYLEISDDGEIVCPYCSRTFKLADGVSKVAEY